VFLLCDPFGLSATVTTTTRASCHLNKAQVLSLESSACTATLLFVQIDSSSRQRTKPAIACTSVRSSADHQAPCMSYGRPAPQFTGCMLGEHDSQRTVVQMRPPQRPGVLERMLFAACVRCVCAGDLSLLLGLSLCHCTQCLSSPLEYRPDCARCSSPLRGMTRSVAHYCCRMQTKVKVQSYTRSGAALVRLPSRCGRRLSCWTCQGICIAEASC
jgi:hypothetical protein